jgi:hypothetical protein
MCVLSLRAAVTHRTHAGANAEQHEAAPCRRREHPAGTRCGPGPRATRPYLVVGRFACSISPAGGSARTCGTHVLRTDRGQARARLRQEGTTAASGVREFTGSGEPVRKELERPPPGLLVGDLDGLKTLNNELYAVQIQSIYITSSIPRQLLTGWFHSHALWLKPVTAPWCGGLDPCTAEGASQWRNIG